MRISDWSSDVCSSDLLRENPRLDLIPPLFRSAAERKSHRRIPPAKVPVKTVFPRIQRLPPYVFNIVGDLKKAARARGDDVIDFSMGNPDPPTPKHILAKLVEPSVRGPAPERGRAPCRARVCQYV